MNCILIGRGSNNYKIPHMGKRRLERLGVLPTTLRAPETVMDYWYMDDDHHINFDYLEETSDEEDNNEDDNIEDDSDEDDNDEDDNDEDDNDDDGNNEADYINNKIEV